MKTDRSLSIDRSALAILLLLSASALGVPDVVASDGCAFQWLGGSGDVNDPNYWDHGECFSDPSNLPGLLVACGPICFTP